MTQRIAEDEVRHYKHFYSYLRKYREREGQRRPGIVGALWNRLRMIDGEDSRMAMRHIYRARNRPPARQAASSRTCGAAGATLIQPHFPHRMCVQMLLKPLDLGHRAHAIAAPLCEAVARRVVP